MASVQAQFMLPLSNVNETKAFVVASDSICVPPSEVSPVKVTTSCCISSSRVAETVKTCQQGYRDQCVNIRCSHI